MRGFVLGECPVLVRDTDDELSGDAEAELRLSSPTNNDTVLLEPTSASPSLSLSLSLSPSLSLPLFAGLALCRDRPRPRRAAGPGEPEAESSCCCCCCCRCCEALAVDGDAALPLPPARVCACAGDCCCCCCCCCAPSLLSPSCDSRRSSLALFFLSCATHIISNTNAIKQTNQYKTNTKPNNK